MSRLLERLRQALSPQFTVERELAGGGMGVVFLGHDVTLDRPVAIKVLRPEQATAIGVERFLREARVLARLRHPNIVPVFQGGEADGLLYHILEYQAGETLSQRLTRGPLKGAKLETLADGLLAALATAHATGVIHRDIKPSNIFLVDGRAVVGDFGIAHTDTGGESLTDAGALLGTRAYMAPEQWRGGASTPQTDLYSAALVLAEAGTGRPAAELATESRAVLPGVSGRWAAALRRALAEDPGVRWSEAAEFREALRGSGQRRRVLTRVGLGLGLVGLLAVLWSAQWGERPPSPLGQFIVALETFGTSGEEERALGRRLDVKLLQALTGLPDVVVVPARASAAARASLRVAGRVRGGGERVEVTLNVSRRGRGPGPTLRAMLSEDLTPAGIDTLVLDILREIWAVDHPGELLPKNALPQTSTGFGLFLRAEQAYAAGEWDEAEKRYLNVERIDPTCVLCVYRIVDLTRWLNRDSDTTLLQGLVAQAERFTPPYRTLILAWALAPAERLDSLLALRGRLDGFFDFHYLLGDELLHRGARYGYSRSLAIDHLGAARRLRPDFSGVTEHLVWAHVTEGDSASAGSRLDTLELQHPLRDLNPFAAGLRVMHLLGFGWRFQPESDAAALTGQLLGDPRISGSEYLPAGPRMMPAFGAPRGAVEFGRALLTVPGRPELRQASLVARTFGWVALGQPDSAIAAARELAPAGAETSWQMMELSLIAWLAVIGERDPGPGLTGRLVEFRDRANVHGDLDHRVEWWLALLSGTGMTGEGAATASPLSVLASANAMAARGRHVDAVRHTDSVSDLDYQLADPFAAATARLLRAEWMVAAGRPHDALNELLWSEHSDVSQISRGVLQAAEVDWAGASLAFWRRAELLALVEPENEERCRLLGEVIRRWGAGAAQAAARANTARQVRVTIPACRVAR